MSPQVFDTPEGFLLGIMVNKKKVKASIIPALENIGSDIVPLISQLIRNSEVSRSLAPSLNF